MYTYIHKRFFGIKMNPKPNNSKFQLIYYALSVVKLNKK